MENDTVAFQYEEMPKDVEKTLNEMNMKGGDLQNENKKRNSHE